jgi:predicted alpha/beta superfamily hydrolase
MSSYTAVDNIIKAFNNATLYPNLKHIVIAGHSLGGQFVQRYAMVGNQLGTSSKSIFMSVHLTRH